MSMIATLIVVPLYTNLHEQASLAMLLRCQPWTCLGQQQDSCRFHHVHHVSAFHKVCQHVCQRHSYHHSSVRKSLTKNNISLNTSIVLVKSILPPPILATDIPDEIHTFYSNATNDNGIKLANLSSVDYEGCCGLGHRLSRMADAAWIAKRLNFGLRTFWGYCGPDTEIFQHLFGVQSKEALENVTSTNHHVMFHNTIPGFQKLRRHGPSYNTSVCQCQEEQIQVHREFYEDLRNRYRHKEHVDKFVNETFRGHTVIGLHVRAGNGEKGDFERKKRGIDDIDEWVHQAAMRIKEMVDTEQWKEPPLLYIATDTPSLIDMFRHELEGVMAVIEFPQERRDEGDGIYFGEQGNKPKLSDYQCIRSWENAVTDMILLSHADVLIAGRISSFVQTLPMSLVFGRNKQKVTTPHCELNVDASRMICSTTYNEWCCEVRGFHIHPRYSGDALMVPKRLSMSRYQPQPRRNVVKEDWNTQMPYYWKTQAYDKKIKTTS